VFTWWQFGQSDISVFVYEFCLRNVLFYSTWKFLILLSAASPSSSTSNGYDDFNANPPATCPKDLKEAEWYWGDISR
jgi:hypothetical protein